MSRNGRKKEKRRLKMANVEELIPFVKSFEGGWADVKGDRGGQTMMGITLATYRRVFGQSKSPEDLKNITEAEWNHIFRRYYWGKWRADQIQSQPIANLLVDWYWMSGSYGVKLPQKVLMVTIDGVVGPITIKAINDYPDQKELFMKLWNERKLFFERIGKGGQSKFLSGWMRRLNSIKWDGLTLNK